MPHTLNPTSASQVYDPAPPSPDSAGQPNHQGVEPLAVTGTQALQPEAGNPTVGLCQCGCGRPAPIASETKRKKGWVKGRPLRFIHGHHGRRDVADRLNDRLVRDEATGCLNWTGYRDDRGYGRIGIGERLEKPHRVAFILSGGQLTADKPLVCHRCDNPSCCEPSHLFAGSVLDNSQDMARKGRGLRKYRGLPIGVYPSEYGKFTACVRVKGELHYLGTFTSSQRASLVVQAFRKTYL